jgi:quercetin dioxygenase-like cupin family protein
MQVIAASDGQSQDMTGVPIFGDGQVWIRTLAGARADAKADVNVAVVQFNPGARTAWHTHSGSQILYVVSGIGKVGDRQGERVISVGDCAVIPAMEEHWHGAADTGSPMSHLAITQAESATELVDA